MEIKKKLYYICSVVLLIVFILVFLLYFRLGSVDLHSGHLIFSPKENIKERVSCNNANVLHECKTDQDCNELCTTENNKRYNCQPYLNADHFCRQFSLDKCNTPDGGGEFCTQRAQDCVPRTFCLHSIPETGCNKKNGGQFVLSGWNTETFGDSKMTYNCSCLYPNIAGTETCDLNPNICMGGTWNYDATEDCSSYTNKNNCYLHNGNTTSCSWDTSNKKCIPRAPDPKIDCVCDENNFLIFRKNIDGTDTPMCVPKTPYMCNSADMCEHIYSDSLFSDENNGKIQTSRQPAKLSMYNVPSYDELEYACNAPSISNIEWKNVTDQSKPIKNNYVILDDTLKTICIDKKYDSYNIMKPQSNNYSTLYNTQYYQIPGLPFVSWSGDDKMGPLYPYVSQNKNSSSLIDLTNKHTISIQYTYDGTPSDMKANDIKNRYIKQKYNTLDSKLCTVLFGKTEIKSTQSLVKTNTYTLNIDIRELYNIMATQKLTYEDILIQFHQEISNSLPFLRWVNNKWISLCTQSTNPVTCKKYSHCIWDSTDNTCKDPIYVDPNEKTLKSTCNLFKDGNACNSYGGIGLKLSDFPQGKSGYNQDKEITIALDANNNPIQNYTSSSSNTTIGIYDNPCIWKNNECSFRPFINIKKYVVNNICHNSDNNLNPIIPSNVDGCNKTSPDYNFCNAMNVCY